MKIFFTSLIVSSFFCFSSFAQTFVPASNATVSRRTIRFNFIKKDSVNLSLNNEFDLIEDSCSEVIRYAHLNMQQRKFFGPIKDVSRLTPGLVLTEGNYTSDGLKDGSFITHYLNGNLQAKGSFKNNKYDGKWEMYYDDGKPKLTFEATEGDIKIIDAWDDKGVKVVDNGKGNFRSDLGILYWKGKLLNGKPDGTWKAIKTDDATNTDLASESFKNGVFQKGTSPVGVYKDASRVVLVTAENLPFTRAEMLRLSSVPCNGVKRKHIVNAQYSLGLNSFSEAIKDLVSPYLSKINLTPYDNNLTLNGEVNQYGIISRLISDNAFNDNIANGLISQLHRLPTLQPATADGKPVTQKFTITFNFYQGIYKFSYRFLPIVVK